MKASGCPLPLTTVLVKWARWTVRYKEGHYSTRQSPDALRTDAEPPHGYKRVAFSTDCNSGLTVFWHLLEISLCGWYGRISLGFFWRRGLSCWRCHETDLSVGSYSSVSIVKLWKLKPTQRLAAEEWNTVTFPVMKSQDSWQQPGLSNIFTQARNMKPSVCSSLTAVKNNSGDNYAADGVGARNNAGLTV